MELPGKERTVSMQARRVEALARRASPCYVIPSDVQTINEQKRYTAEVIPVHTIARITASIPLVVPALGAQLSVDELLKLTDGLMVPGGITNVHPSVYGQEPPTDNGPFDAARDATSLPLVRRALQRGIPILMTCRKGLNVALGGTLKHEPDNLPEDKKHGTPKSAKTENERYVLRHFINVVPGGRLAGILGLEKVRVNSLHSQLIDRLAPGLVVEATAEDGSIEAVTVEWGKAFTLGVIFHPEYWAERDGPSLAILRAFGRAVQMHAAAKRALREVACV